MPWHTSGRFAFSPINATSKKPYRGINTVCLWAAAQAKGYDSGEWATYQQWQEKKAQVRKGEKATLVVFWKFANESSETDDGESPKSGSRLLFTRGYACSMLPRWMATHLRLIAEMPMPERIAHAEVFFTTIGATVGTAEIRPSIRLHRIISRCRPSLHSEKACPTIPRWPMSTPIGPLPRAVVIVSLGSDSVIRHMPPRNS